MLAFTRQLGARSGVQLNYPIDNTEGFAAGNSDQAFGTFGAFQRGRTDKAFKVNRSNFKRYLGASASISLDEMNETYLHIYEAFKTGANEAVLARLEASDAVMQFITISGTAVTNAAVAGLHANFTLAAYDSGTQPIIMKIAHHERFNDGVNIRVAADANGASPSKLVTLKLFEVGTGKELYSFYGSLDPLAKDDFGNSIFLPEVVASYTDNVEVVVAAGAQVETTAYIYGGVYSNEDLTYYAPGVAALTNAEYDIVIGQLRYNEFDHRYFITAGSQAVYGVSELARIAKEMNKPIAVDTPAGYTKSQAITWVDSIAELVSSYVHIYWTPIKAADPLNGGKAIWGTSGMQIGYRCARNARTDANGVPPMNYPIAGAEYSITRNNMVQLEFPTDNDLDDLATKGINPVIFKAYNSGGRYVFVDSLTCLRKESALKLIAVSDMSSQVDEWIAKYGDEILQLPMQDYIRRMQDFMTNLFEALFTARWIKPSAELDGFSYKFTVTPNNARPNDRVDVNFALHYDGTVRALYVQQTLSK